MKIYHNFAITRISNICTIFVYHNVAAMRLVGSFLFRSYHNDTANAA